MKSKIRQQIQMITSEGGGVSAEDVARTREMLVEYMHWKSRKAQIAQAEKAQSPSKERQP